MEKAGEFDIPWIEKYRPDRLDDVVGNEELVGQLKTIAEKGNIPNLILSGPPGTGKTTSVMALAHELLKDNFKKGVIELNASDERGIDVVRDRIKSFANQKINLPERRHKIIILDEADSMTEAAQQALRVIISDYSATTRFALACNDSSKIIEPIQSRCCVLRFNKLKNENVKDRLVKIMQLENINYDDHGVNDLVETSDGDMRYALNNLQSTYVGFGSITHENVYKIIDIPKPEALLKIVEHCEKGELDFALDRIDELYGEGYSSMDIINVCGRVLKNKGNITDKKKFKALKEVTKYKLRFYEGIDSAVQMYSFVSDLITILNSDISSAMDIS